MKRTATESEKKAVLDAVFTPLESEPPVRVQRSVPLHGSVAFVLATRRLDELLRRRDIYEDDKLLEAFQIGREYEQSVQGNSDYQTPVG